MLPGRSRDKFIKVRNSISNLQHSDVILPSANGVNRNASLGDLPFLGNNNDLKYNTLRSRDSKMRHS